MTDVHDPTLGDLVTANPAAARLLDGLGLDYCCRGDRTLTEACAAAGLRVDDVSASLAELDRDHDETWTMLDAPALTEHIVATHHRYLWEELPLLEELSDKVERVHGAAHPELADVRELVAAIRADLEPHLLKEERVLFPAIAALAQGQTDFAFGSVANPIRMMLLEHDRAGELLTRLRVATEGYTPPADGCTSYRTLYERLAALDLDTHVHIHKENQVLFPAALSLAEG